MRQPSVLVLSPIASHPANQGNAARIQALALELRRRNIAVDFFYYGMEGLTSEQAEEMRRFWNRFIFMRSLPLPRPSLPVTWGLDDWCPDALCEQVAATVAQHDYDAIIVNYVWMSKVLERLDGPLKIIDTHDLFGDRHIVAEQSKLEPRWFFTTIAEEDRGVARADVVIGIQKTEAEHIRSRVRGQTITVGHPVEPQFLMQERRADPFFTFGYLGSGNPFNVKSLEMLDRALDDSLRGQWALAGSISRRRLSLQSRPFRMGLVDSLADFYDHVDCVLNPMVGGTGLKIKTIEGLAFGRPVIGTVDAFEGLDTAHPFHQLKDMAGMATAMKAYHASPDLRRELAAETFRVFSRYMLGVTEQYDALAGLIRSARPGTRSGDAARRVA